MWIVQLVAVIVVLVASTEWLPMIPASAVCADLQRHRGLDADQYRSCLSDASQRERWAGGDVQRYGYELKSSYERGLKTLALGDYPQHIRHSVDATLRVDSLSELNKLAEQSNSDSKILFYRYTGQLLAIREEAGSEEDKLKLYDNRLVPPSLRTSIALGAGDLSVRQRAFIAEHCWFAIGRADELCVSDVAMRPVAGGDGYSFEIFDMALLPARPVSTRDMQPLYGWFLEKMDMHGIGALLVLVKIFQVIIALALSTFIAAIVALVFQGVRDALIRHGWIHSRTSAVNEGLTEGHHDNRP